MTTEAGTTLAKRGDMVWTEAKATCESIRGAFDRIKGLAVEIRGELLDLHDRKGWAVLGYETWKACVEAEFKISYRAVNLELQAAKIEREMEQADADGMGKIFPSHNEPLVDQEKLPSSQLRALKEVEPDQRREVIREAKATAPNGKTTEKHVKETADRKVGKPKPEPAPAVPRSQFKATVNGQVAADPSDIAAKRAAGKIGADVEVEVTEPEPDEEPEAEPIIEAGPGEPEEEWLAALPLSTALKGISLAIFQDDARRYFRMKAARDAVRHHNGIAGKKLRKDGEYLHRILGFLKLADPKHWIKCTTPDNGGCGGTGQVSLVGSCPMCFGRGYTINNQREWRNLA